MEMFVRFIYYLTLPFAGLSRVMNGITEEPESFSTIAYIVGLVATIAYFINGMGDTGYGILLVLFLLYIGLFPLIMFVVHLLIMAAIELAWLGISAFAAINNLCYAYMSGSAGRNDYEGAYSDEEEQEYQRAYDDADEWSDNRYTSDADSSFRSSEYARAEALFGMTGSYTVEQLRHRRRDLMKKCHPDEGGSNHMAQEINAAYDILEKYAAACRNEEEGLCCTR